MSSFDDLQFSGLQSSTTVPVPCSMCGRILDVAPTALTCPAGHILPPHSLNPLLPHHLPPASRPPPTHPTPTPSSPSPFLPFPGLSDLAFPPSSTFLDLLRAQQGLNVDELLQSLLTEPGYEGTPTSAEYLKALREEGLREDEFVQVMARVEGVERDVLPTWGEFGGRVRHQLEEKVGRAEGGEEQGGSSEGKEGEGKEGAEVQAERLQEHVQCELVMAEPLDGKGLSNGAELRGRAVLLSRGRITFVDKCRAVQQSGARLALVQQTEDTWPYLMTDQTHTGKDIVTTTTRTARTQRRMSSAALAAPLSSAHSSTAPAPLCVWLRGRRAFPVC